MKRILVIATAWVALCASPLAAQQLTPEMMAQMQQLQSMSPEEQERFMQQAMQHAEKLQLCIEKSGGQAKLLELQQLYDAHSQQIDALCDAGKTEQAEAYLRDVLKESESDPRLRQLRDCGMDVLKANPEFASLSRPEAASGAIKNICD